MNDTEFDTMLRDAAPQPTPVVGLAAHRERILRDVRQRRARRSKMWAGSLAVTALLVGGGSMAVAGDGNETPWGWVADNVFIATGSDGSTCFQGIRVLWEGLADDDPLVQDAQAFVRDIDLENLDTAAKEAEYKADLAAADPVLNEDGELERIEMSDAAIKQQVVHLVVADALWEELQVQGHEMSPGHEVSLSSDTEKCN